MSKKTERHPEFIGIAVDPALKRQIQLVANEHDRSVSGEARVALRWYVTEMEKKRAA